MWSASDILFKKKIFFHFSVILGVEGASFYRYWRRLSDMGDPLWRLDSENIARKTKNHNRKISVSENPSYTNFKNSEKRTVARTRQESSNEYLNIKNRQSRLKVTCLRIKPLLYVNFENSVLLCLYVFIVYNFSPISNSLFNEHLLKHFFLKFVEFSDFVKIFGIQKVSFSSPCKISDICIKTSSEGLKN